MIRVARATREQLTVRNLRTWIPVLWAPEETRFSGEFRVRDGNLANQRGTVSWGKRLKVLANRAHILGVKKVALFVVTCFVLSLEDTEASSRRNRRRGGSATVFP